MDIAATNPPEGKKRGRPKANGRNSGVVALKGTPEWKAWLDGFAVHCRLGLAGVIDLALERLADQRDYPPPPKRL